VNGKLPIFMGTCRVFGKRTCRELSDVELKQACLYVLNNCDEVSEFAE